MNDDLKTPAAMPVPYLGKTPKSADVVVVGSGHNALVCALLLARAGKKVVVLEQKRVVGGAVRTEYPFQNAPKLGVSTGAYLLGVMQPELIAKLGLNLPLRRRDPHYFLPTQDHRYLLIGSDEESVKRQYSEFFTPKDWGAHCAMNAELAQLRDDLAPAGMASPLSVEATAEKYIRPALRKIFVDLVKGTAMDYLARFGFESPLILAMYAMTDAFSGLNGSFHTKGTGHNLLVHNMCRLPNSHGTWMIVEGGMGTISRTLAEAVRAAGGVIETDAEVGSIDVANGAVQSVTLKRGDVIKTGVVVSGADPFRTRDLIGRDRLPQTYNTKVDGLLRDGTTMKVNLAFDRLPKFTCLPEDKGQYGPTIHILPQGPDPIGTIQKAFDEVQAGRLAEEPTIEWYFHTPVDPSLRDDKGNHNGALFVQWVPYALSGGKTWADEESRYVKHLLSICDRFAPETSKSVIDAFVLTPPKIEEHFGITRGHIHHVDNGFAFDERAPYTLPSLAGVFQCSAGCHPAGSVIGAAGHNAAEVILEAMR
ncbi:MAG: phytoene desaturase family protein [Polyangiales bacterium]